MKKYQSYIVLLIFGLFTFVFSLLYNPYLVYGNIDNVRLKNVVRYETNTNIVKSGICGDNVTWTLDSEGIMTISGKGDITSRPWENIEHFYKVNSIIINYGITRICAHAFRGFNVSSIVIPNSVNKIDMYAFYYCQEVDEIIIPNSVQIIDEYAFAGCHNLTNISISNNLTTISDGLFYDCQSLSSIIIPNSVKTIGNEVFSYCRNLENIEIPNSVVSIGNNTFRECKGLTNISFPNGITTIGDGLFIFCEQLREVNLPNSVATIGRGAFCKCSNLTQISIPNRVTLIADNTFDHCTNLKSITIPNSVSKIGKSAFAWCLDLKDVYYEGNEDDWDKIVIDNSELEDNDAIFSATIHYLKGNTELKMTPIAETTYNGHKYVFYDNNVSWNDAAKYCLTQGGYLLSIENRNEDDYIVSWINSISSKTFSYEDAVWLGLSRTNGVWKWESGSDYIYNTSYDSWHEGDFPDNLISLIDFYDTTDWMWRAAESTSKCFFVCEWGSIDNYKDDDVVITLRKGNNAYLFNPLSESVNLVDDDFSNIHIEVKLNQIKYPDNTTFVRLLGSEYQQIKAQYEKNTDKDVFTIDFIPIEIAPIESECLYLAIYKENNDNSSGLRIEQLDRVELNINVKSHYLIQDKYYDIRGEKIQSKWGWNLFKSDTYQFNQDLAYTGLYLSDNSYSDSNQDGSDKMSSIDFAFTELGFCNTHNYNYDVTFNLDNPAFSISSKELLMNNESKVIIAVVVRGTHTPGVLSDIVYGADIKTDLKAAFDGFSSPTNNTYSKLKKYINEYYSNYSKENIIFFITGHSLGGAVSAKLAQRIRADGYLETNSYIYTFASPLYTVDYYDIYNNVHNVIHNSDVFPQIPWEKERIGEDKCFDLNIDYGDKNDLDKVIINHSVDSYRDGVRNNTYTSKYHNNMKRSSILCPVDISVYQNGIFVAKTNGESIEYSSNDNTDIIILTEGEHKYIYSPLETEYSIEFIGTDKGTMKYSLETYNSDTNTVKTDICFHNVTLEKDKRFSSEVLVNSQGEINNYDIDLKVVDSSGNPIKEVEKNGIEIEIEGSDIFIRDSGIIGDLSWVVSEKSNKRDCTLRISGTGEIPDFQNDSAPWYSYMTDIEKIIIENGITRIGAYAFNGCNNLRIISLPKSVNFIDMMAVKDSYRLSDVYYVGGTQEEWDEITTTTGWVFMSVRTHFTSIDLESPASIEPIIMVVKQKTDLQDVFIKRFGRVYGKYSVSNKKASSINKKGFFKAKKADKIEVKGYVKSGKEWELDKIVDVYIEKPHFKKKTVKVTVKGQTVDSMDNMENCSISPTEWKTSNTKVALVDPLTGVVTVVGKGKATITAVFGEGKNKAKYSYKIKSSIPAS